MAVVVVALVAALSACQPAGAISSTPGTTPAVRTVPDVVGRPLPDARSTARAAGFGSVTSHDATPAGRHQILDRDWTVCAQTPVPGPAPIGATVDLAVAKTSEGCTRAPGAPGGRAPTGTMPPVVGRDGAAALAALGSGVRPALVDASGRGRVIVVPSHWRVCTQQPAPGAPQAGTPIILTLAKTEEPC